MATKTFNSRIQLPSGENRYLPDCVIYKGKVAKLGKKGVGKAREMGGMFDGEGHTWEEYDRYEESHIAIYNKTLIPSTGLSQRDFEKLDAENKGDLAFNNEILLSCMFTLGENPGGYIVVNRDEEKSREEQKEIEERGKAIKAREKAINFTQGIFGYKTSGLPRDIWNVIQPFSMYHKGGESDQEWADDMGYVGVDSKHLKGWFYSGAALQALLDKGYRVSYRGVEINVEDDLETINDKFREEEKKHHCATDRYERERRRLIAIRQKLFKDGGNMEESETDEIQKLTTLLFPAIEVNGADIYGGGVWFHEDDSHLYIVRNNGMDGDDWSWNNYRTGGAGAICKRVEKNEEVEKFLADANEFETKKIEDYYED